MDERMGWPLNGGIGRDPGGGEGISGLGIGIVQNGGKRDGVE